MGGAVACDEMHTRQPLSSQLMQHLCTLLRRPICSRQCLEVTVLAGVVNKLAFPKPPKEWSELDLRNAPELLWLTTSNNQRIPALHIVNRNAEDIGLALPYLRQMSQFCDCDVFAAEYVGYSIAEGEPSEEGCYESINAAWAYLLGINVSPGLIVPFGRSLGSGPTVDLVSRQRSIQGMVIQSGLESGGRAVVPKWVSFVGQGLDIFLNYKKIEHVQARTLIIHGTVDEVVPCKCGEALYQSLSSRGLAHEPLWIEGKGHNNLPAQPCLMAVKGLLRHLRAHEAASPPESAFRGDEGFMGEPLPLF